MGIMDFFRKKTSVNEEKRNEMDFVDKNDNKNEQKEEFVAPLSYVELQNADWVKFAGILKREGVLAPSYEKRPSEINYSVINSKLSSNVNTVKVELIFNSKTSDSVRKVDLYNDEAVLYVNGAPEKWPQTQRNKDLNRLWKEYQNRIRYYNMLETGREGISHVRRGEKLFKQAQSMMSMGDIYEREQDFLEKNKDVMFDGFSYAPIFERDKNGYVGYVGELPSFIPLQEMAGGYCVDGEPIIPFSPRTLEHCILHMTNGLKIEEGESIKNFEKKCRQIQEYSCFESDKWNSVINFGKGVVMQQFQVNAVENMLH